MALRLANKINRQFVKDVCRSLSAKREGVPELEPALQKTEDATKSSETAVPPPTPTAAIRSMPIQYEVCRPRNIPVTQFQHSVKNETDVAKNTVAIQHMQPAMLPEYYKPPVEINSSCMYNNIEQLRASNRQMSSKRFEDSKTCSNVTLPLKGTKLASPFPDPVKVMQSHTVSDQEKAEQMLAEAKSVKNASHVPKQKQRKHSSIRAMPQNMSYSTGNSESGGGSKKCKKLNEKKEKQCVHLRAAGCIPPKSISCRRREKSRAQCVKKESPYPSYSETCHEDPYNKPSECKICPYRGDENPHFKPPKQKFHTFSSPLAAKSKGDCKQPPNMMKTPCAWERADQKATKTISQKKKGPAKPKKKASANIITELLNEPEVLANVPPPPAPQIPTRKLPTKKNEAPVLPKRIGQQSATSLTGEMGSWLGQFDRKNLIHQLGAVTETQIAAAEESTNQGKCKKFPFKECPVEIVKERKQRPQHGKCPTKERPKLVDDCPPEKDDGKCKRAVELNQPQQYTLSSKDKCKPPSNSKKCPKFNVCIDPSELESDPCGTKRKGTTRTCPDDLLKKKRNKPKKKRTSAAVPLGQIASQSRLNKTTTTVSI